jgi:HK97 gp10 family phage protein
MARIVDHSQEIINATDEAIYNALYIIGAKAADYAAGKAPVDTGLLKNSMTFAMSGEEPILKKYSSDDGKKEGEYSGAVPKDEMMAVYVGTNVEYAPYVEYGTVKQKAKPFLKPAIESHLDEYKHILEEELKM